MAVVVAANLAIGWSWGYRTIGPYLGFWLLAGLTFVTARVVTDRVFRPTGTLNFAVSSGIVAFAIVVLCGLLLGVAPRLTLASYLLGQTTLLVAATLLPRDPASPIAKSPDDQITGSRPSGSRTVGFAVPVWVVAIVGALTAMAIAFGIANSPLTLYDSLSYHLFFPARWLQEHRLSIIPTPFSDEAQAYAPANDELFFLWLMLPFHGDLLARLGQLPFAALAAVTLYAMGRRLGASREQSIYPPVFFILSRPILEQAIGANVDLVCAATFLTSLYLGLVAIEQNRGRDWALWGVSVGLTCGTKYLALVYAPVFLALPLIPGRGAARHARADTGPSGWPPGTTRLLSRVIARSWALPGIAAFGLPWYARNWVVAGSPIYPATLRLAGITVARGAFDRTAMLNSVFHTTSFRLFPVMAAHAFGPTLFVIWLPVAVVGGVALARRGWWPYAFLCLVPYVMAALFWFGLPVNVDSRFLMPAIAPALLPFAFTFRSSRVWNAAVHGVYAAAMLWIVVGTEVDVPASVPWFMRGWLSLNGLVNPPFLSWCAALVLLFAALWRFGPMRTQWALPFASAVLATTTTALAVGGEHLCVPSRCEYLDVTSPHIGMDLVYGWRWMAEHAHDTTVAYTGINLPYPLTGERLANVVVYANIDGRTNWRFHDYDRAYRAGRFTPAPPLLATGSGELLPAPDAGPDNAAARPRYERMEGFRDGWMNNLKKLHVGYLFIAALSPYEIDNVWHNEHGFPIEDAWAAADPRSFHLVYENSLVRVFGVQLEEGAQTAGRQWRRSEAGGEGPPE